MGQLSKLLLVLALTLSVASALNTTYYAKTCPNVETLVQQAVKKKFQQTFVTIPATLRLFFHDCFVQGCDASVMIQSAGGNTAEKDHSDNLSLAGDGFDTVIKAKAAVDANSQCRNKVSCADILALATRDVVVLAGGKSYPVELGRFDGLRSKAGDVNGKLPKPTFKVDQLNTMFKANGLSQQDMIALSAAHTVGFSHCNHVAGRIGSQPDRTVNSTYLTELRNACPKNVDSRIAINMDPNTPRTFDNMYFKNLQQRKGLFTSDQDLWESSKTKKTVDDWAKDANAFNNAFATAMTNLGRVGVKTSKNGNIRKRCDAFN